VLHTAEHNAAEALRSAVRRFGGKATSYRVYPSTRSPQWRETSDLAKSVEAYESDFLGVGLVLTRRPHERVWLWSVQRLRAQHESPCEVAGGSCTDLTAAKLYAERAAKELLP
jgi:hypothetical protein